MQSGLQIGSDEVRHGPSLPTNLLLACLVLVMAQVSMLQLILVQMREWR